MQADESQMDIVKEEEKAEFECKEFDLAVEVQDSDPQQAIALYKTAIATVVDKDDEAAMVKIKEQSVYGLTKLYAKSDDKANLLKGLLAELRPLFSSIAKAKTAKIVKTILEIVDRAIEDIDLQATICNDAISWCNQEKRTFLKQRMQSRLAALMIQQGQYKPALRLISKLAKEVKRFDDKLLLVEIELIESRVHLLLQNVPKAKGALTAARSAANAVYCPPLLQAQIDLQAGTLCAEEKDYKTAFSYFYEAFEGYNTVGDSKKAVLCLKYMLLGKIMNNHPEEVYSIVNGKAGVKYAGKQITAMKSVADAYKERSIHSFQTVYAEYSEELGDDPVVKSHLKDLRENLLEQNLIRLIEPFERVQIAHVAKLIDLPAQQVEQKLSEMILDKKFAGILDQGSGDLIVFDDAEGDVTYTAAIDTMKELGGVVDRLYTKATTLAA
jgi:26S proteasome regulatory subunit N6